MTVAVIQFPGSNCEQDTLDALNELSINASLIPWNTTSPLGDVSGIILPGGFSYQDRIRAGALAAKCHIMNEVKQVAKTGIPVLGICNGAQILVESGLIDANDNELSIIIDSNYSQGEQVHFISDWYFLRPFNSSTSIFLKSFSNTDVLPIQLCHGEGRYLFKQTPTAGFQYCGINGTLSDAHPITPNGSQNGIAAIANSAGNVLAIMPHPERSIDPNRIPFSIRAHAEKNGYTIKSWRALFEVFAK